MHLISNSIIFLSQEYYLLSQTGWQGFTKTSLRAQLIEPQNLDIFL